MNHNKEYKVPIFKKKKKTQKQSNGTSSIGRMKFKIVNIKQSKQHRIAAI